MTTSTDRATGLRAAGNDNVLSLSRRELFWRSRFQRDTDSLAHLPLLFWLVCDLRPDTAVTLGMQTGVMHFGICQALDKSGQDGMCYGFGAWAGAVPEDLAGYNAREYEEISRLAVAEAQAAADGFGAGSVDLLVFEERMSAAQLDLVFGVWLPKMSSRGVVVLSGGTAEPGLLRRVLEERKSALPHVGFDFGGGIDILLVGTEWPERLGNLVDLVPDVPVMRSMTRVLARIGALHVNEWRVTQQTRRADILSAELDSVSSGGGTVRRDMDQLPGRAADIGADRAALAAEKAALEEARAALIAAQKQSFADEIPAPSAASVDLDGLAVLTQKLEATQDELLELRKAQKQMEKAQEQTEREHQAHEAYRDKLRREAREQAQQIKTLKKINADLLEDRQLIQQSLDHLRASSSWRLTKPLRQIRETMAKK